MGTVKFYIRTKNNPAKIYCRFVNGRSIDLRVPLLFVVNPNHWDAANQKIRNVIEVKNRDEINRSLSRLKVEILDSFNSDYAIGEVIDKSWFKTVISEFFKRPSGEDKAENNDHKVYYTDFATWWIENKAKSWLTSTGKYMNEREKSKYKAFIEIVKEFQGKNKLVIKKTNHEAVMNLVDYLHANDYASSTIKRHINRFKFFLNRADQENIRLDKSYLQRVFIPESVEVKEPYLNIKEITAIYNHDFSHNKELDKVRDNLIIACWTGLRISDFLRLDTSNFIDNEIHIKTKKTGASVVIPVHNMVEKILIKKNGKLDNDISDQKFNVLVKKVCAEVGINEKIKGKILDPKKKRKVITEQPKHMFISSHIGRRSFATNLIGKLDDATIMAIGGWSSKEVMYGYIKKTSHEHADKLKKYWSQIE